MNFQTYFLLILFACPTLLAKAQNTLSLESAIQEALANNHQIQIKQYDEKISAMQIDPAMVGKKPIVEFNASYQFGWSDASIETLALNPGAPESDPIELNGISNSIQLGPEIRLMLLDGKASTYRLEQLEAANGIAKLQLQQAIEQTIAQVTSAYLQMAQMQSLIDITEQSLELTKERLARAEEDASYGTSSSLQYLQIEVDLKTDSASLRDLELNRENAQRNLNRLMGKAPENEFEINTTVTLNPSLSLRELQSSLLQRNTILRLRGKNIRMADLDVQLSKAAFRPTLQAYANNTFSYLQNDANFLQVSRTVGPNIGVRFNYPIFDGGARKIKSQSAQLRQEQRFMERTDTQDELIKELHNAYATYQNTLEQLKIEQSNLKMFERNLENMQNMYTLGTATNTDVRAAQLNLNAAQNRISNYQYTIKQAEVQLYLLAGLLINQ
ncbi:MAG: TolC family protein [Bacteroidota bacterium]